MVGWKSATPINTRTNRGELVPIDRQDSITLPADPLLVDRHPELSLQTNSPLINAEIPTDDYGMHPRPMEDEST
jgi:hypothetical protein